MATYILGAVLLAALFFAVRGMVRHFGGGGACCGGGGSIEGGPKKKLYHDVIG